MAAVHKLNGGFLVSISTLAGEFKMGRDTVSRRLEQAGVGPADTIKGSPVYRLRDACKAILGVTGIAIGVSTPIVDQQFDPAQLPPQDRLAWMRSETERLKVETAKGELVPVAVHEAQIAAVIKRTVMVLATLPDRLEREAGLSTAAVDRAVIVCDAARAEYYEGLLEEI